MQLLEVFDYWTAALDKGIPVDVVYFDFWKAFDSVPHKRMLKKIEAYGITGKLLKWVSDFLTKRLQRVVIGEATSDWMEVLSGIPQGSVLGPLLFLIYINDLPDVIKGFVKLFADDTKLYGPMRGPSDRDVMNSNIQSMYDWSCDWQLGFNFKKCKRIHMGHSNPHNSYTIDTVTIEESDCERDLGIMVDHKLSFDQHISTIVNKANRLLGQIKRSFVSRNKKVLMPIYKNIIRPMVNMEVPYGLHGKRKT